jgi:hypothetical protein
VPPRFSEALNRLAIGNGSWPLLVIGPVGTGKTYSAVAALDRFGGVYHTASGLCEKLIVADQQGIAWPDIHLTGYDGGDNGIWRSEHLWRHLLYHQLVVLDELGAKGIATPTQRGRIQELLDLREGRPVILISNVGTDGIQEIYGDRVLSRAMRGITIYLGGDDRRQVKA